VLWSIFVTFFKIGAFTIGGGYAMIPLIRNEVVKRHQWLNDTEFMDGLAAAQSCPGPIAINVSAYVGFRLKRYSGLLAASLGALLPSLVIILIIASTLTRFTDYPAVRRVFHALKPAVVALIALPVIQMSRSGGVNRRTLWIPVFAAGLVSFLYVNPVYLIIATILWALSESLPSGGKRS